MLRTLKHLLRDRKGATVVEYAVLCAMLFFAIMATVQGVASETNSMWTRVNTTMQNATAA
ncbi:Flp family type IVb pilin [Novosphingobium piscinae]|uniref:Flp family type IVb pilin n=1 Tax=Novosphingobium piscinae TaxID=1507448 RepID=A0A7X1G0Y9_9SPHN|nr:Flp family type IVb pilin [Novosphingobium piscinae]MBC2670639.1 Flp family type IVb pilin [Novosphingobium piscinae]